MTKNYPLYIDSPSLETYMVKFLHLQKKMSFKTARDFIIIRRQLEGIISIEALQFLF